MKFGRRRPHPARVEKQVRFRAPAGIVVPDGWDYGTMCMPALQTMLANGPDPTAPSQVAALGLGDCTCAAVGHAIDVWTAGGGSGVVITADQIVTLYSLACGYVLGDPATDQGGDELSVLDYVQANGIDGKGLHKLAGTASLDGADVLSVRQAMLLCGPTPFCGEMPDGWALPSAGTVTVWDVSGPPNPSRGHCWLPVSYSSNGPGPGGKPAFGCISWGFLVWTTTDAVSEYCVEANGGSVNAALSQEWCADGATPYGITRAAMQQAFGGLGS